MANFAMLISIVKSAIEKTAHLLNLQNYLNDADGQIFENAKICYTISKTVKKSKICFVFFNIL